MATNSNASQSSIHSFSWNHHRQTFFNTIFNLRKEEVFCDVTLACDGILFPAHRLVLAMCSEFFNEILTKVPSQQPMLVLVPTVSAEDLAALLTYIYRGEMQVPRANLPSIMKAAKTLKIKGFCNTNVEETLLDQNGPGEETNIMESDEENNCRENIYSVSHDSPEEIAQENKLLPKLRELGSSGCRYPQVEVFIDNIEESQDMMYEGEEVEADKEEIREVTNTWMNMEEEELDPLSVPLLAPHKLSFTPPNLDSTTFTPVVPMPLEVSLSEDSCQEQLFNTSASAATTSSGSRYTAEQKLEMVKNYYHYGPTKTARLMSELLGRKINESSVRSIVRAWIRNQKASQTMKGEECT